MGMLGNVFEAVVNATASAVAKSLLPQEEVPGRIERLCQELGWSIDERNGEGVVLYFNDPAIGVRKVLVTEGAKVMLISTFSAAVIPASRVPIEVIGYLLTRNTQLAAAAWQAAIMDNGGNVKFALAYCALVEGLDTAAFKVICETMVNEAHEFDVKMRAAGLL
jgi:hypothetical protein